MTSPGGKPTRTQSIVVWLRSLVPDQSSSSFGREFDSHQSRAVPLPALCPFRDVGGFRPVAF